MNRSVMNMVCYEWAVMNRSLLKGNQIKQLNKLNKCSSTVFVMVHPLNMFDELMHPIYLKDKPK